MSNPLSADQMRERFLQHVAAIVKWWETESRVSAHEKLSGIAFSILAAIDGAAIDLPAFTLIPSPHPSDKAFHEARDEPYWTETDLAGELHSEFAQKYP